MKLTFKNLYNITKEALHGSKETIVKEKNIRALEAAISSAEEVIIDSNDELAKTYGVVSEGAVIDFNRVLEIKGRIFSAEETIKELRAVKKELFED